jgi:hypothetical protein
MMDFRLAGTGRTAACSWRDANVAASTPVMSRYEFMDRWLGRVLKLPLCWFEQKTKLRKASKAGRHECRVAFDNAAGLVFGQIAIRRASNRHEPRCPNEKGPPSCAKAAEDTRPSARSAALFRTIWRSASFAGILKHALAANLFCVVDDLLDALKTVAKRTDGG